MVLSGIAMQHADDGYSRCGNSGGSFVHSMFLMYLPDGTNVFRSRDEGFEGKDSVYGFGSYKIVFLGGTNYSLVLLSRHLM